MPGAAPARGTVGHTTGSPKMTMAACAAARVLGKVSADGSGSALLAGGRGILSRLGRAAVRNIALRAAAGGLAGSETVERRQVASLLAAAIEAEDYAAAVALLSTAGRRPDRRAEKIVSHRYGFVWICNPKAASRSLIAALRAADPGALLVRGRTLDEVLAGHPEARRFYRFAFVRHPWTRTYSFYADKHARARRVRDDYRWFIAPYHGVTLGMGFDALCRWLNTPCGADAFADRHWLSQSLQIATADGRLPDFVGSYEHLEADWRTVAARLGLPRVGLPRLNARPPGTDPDEHPDTETVALLRRRYAADFRLGGYPDTP